LATVVQPLVEGVRYVWSTPAFRTLISLTYANMLLGTAYVQIMPVFAESMRIGEAGYGGLVAMTGVGAVSGTVLVSSLTRFVRRQTIMFMGLVASGMCIVIFAGFAELEPQPWVTGMAFAFVALAGFCSSCYLVCSMTALQLRVPDRLRGRVMGVHSIAYSLIPLGGLLLGSIAAVSSASIAAALGATMLMLFVAAIALTGVKLD
jgi:MFS family permease